MWYINSWKKYYVIRLKYLNIYNFLVLLFLDFIEKIIDSSNIFKKILNIEFNDISVPFTFCSNICNAL